jgi:ParB family chromosome partitioning protein
VKLEPKRRALGKGLASLIPDAVGVDPLAERAFAPTAGPVTGQVEIPVASIRPNPHQPRRRFDEAETAELTESIRETGVLQPLLVRPESDGGYTLIAGERRLRAARNAGLTSVPAVFRDYPDQRLLELALIENLQRDDLGPMETARAFRVLVREFGLTQIEVAKRIGKPRSTVTNFLRLLELPAPVQNLLDEGSLDMGHGRALAGLENARLQERLALVAAARAWSVREVEDRVRRLTEAPREGAPAASRRDPNVVSAEKTLSRTLEAGVTIHVGRGGRGRIEIRFAGEEDLDRLYRLLIRTAGKANH